MNKTAPKQCDPAFRSGPAVLRLAAAGHTALATQVLGRRHAQPQTVFLPVTRHITKTQKDTLPNPLCNQAAPNPTAGHTIRLKIPLGHYDSLTFNAHTVLNMYKKSSQKINYPFQVSV
jgi:hypothetical protein